MEEQVRLTGWFSVAGSSEVRIRGGDGFSRTVKLNQIVKLTQTVNLNQSVKLTVKLDQT